MSARAAALPATAWMPAAGGEHGDHAGLLPDGRMPGMATPADVASLTTLPVEDAEVRFLQLMAAHHVAGVEMGEAGAEAVEDPDVRALAESIVSGQSAELDVLHGMLAERGSAEERAAHAGR